MNNTIESDFAEFVTNNELFNSEVKLYDSQGGTLRYEGHAIYDKKPQLVENESGQVFYQGHKSILSFAMSNFDDVFMTAYFSLKGYFVEIIDNIGTKIYNIENSNYNSNVNSIYCELKEATPV